MAEGCVKGFKPTGGAEGRCGAVNEPEERPVSRYGSGVERNSRREERVPADYRPQLGDYRPQSGDYRSQSGGYTGGSRKRLRSPCSPSQLPPHKEACLSCHPSSLSAAERMLERSPPPGIRSFAGSVAWCGGERRGGWEGDGRGRTKRWEDERREKRRREENRRGDGSWEGGREKGRSWERDERGERSWGNKDRSAKDRRKCWEDDRIGREGRRREEEGRGGRSGSDDGWRHRHDVKGWMDNRRDGGRKGGDWRTREGGGGVEGRGKGDVRRRQRLLVEQMSVSDEESDTITIFTASLPDQYYEKNEQVSCPVLSV